MTALENVELPMILLGKYDDKERKKKAVALLKRVGLGDRLDHLPSELSVGSSKSKISGSFASARAIATLYCSPPESSDGRWSRRSPRPTLLRRATALLRLSFSLLCLFNRIIGSSTFSSADIVANRLKV